MDVSSQAQPADAEIVDTETVMDGSRIRELHIRVAVLGGLVLFMDGFNTQVIGYIMPQIAREWHIVHAMLGPIFSSSLIGVLLGQLAVAPLCGMLGHKRVTVGCTAAFGILTLATGYTEDVTTLTVLRFLTGIGLGGAMPVAWSLIGEYAPRRWRSTFLVFGTCGVTFGSMAAGIIAAALLEHFGWRPVLWVGGGFTLAVAVMLIFALPESLEYLVNRVGDRQRVARLLTKIDASIVITPATLLTSGAATRKSPIRQLFQADRAYGTMAIWCAFFMIMMVYYFVQNWLTTILVDAGHDQRTAISVASVIQVGGICSAFFIGPLMDRLNPYKVLAFLFVAGGISVAAVGAVATLPAIFATVAAFWEGFFILGLQKGMIAGTIYFYPMALRSTAIGWGTSFGRSGAVVGPLIAGLFLSAGWHSSSVFYVALIPMMLGAIAWIALLRRYAKAAPEREIP